MTFRLTPLLFALPLLGQSGTLVIAGGGKLPERLYQTFVQASGGKGARIAVLPTASGEPKESAAAMVDRLKALGAVPVVMDPRTRAQSEALAADLQGCTGFWFTGGDQKRIHDLVVGTGLHRALTKAYLQGAAVGGTSAGAAVMTRIMLEGQADVSETAPGTYKTLEGLGLLPGCIVDQHFLRRARHNRLLSLLMEHSDHLGLGIDEETAVVVKGGAFRVVGERRVLVLDPTALKTVRGTFQDLRLHLLGEGQGLDLKTRQPSGPMLEPVPLTSPSRS